MKFKPPAAMFKIRSETSTALRYITIHGGDIEGYYGYISTESYDGDIIGETEEYDKCGEAKLAAIEVANKL